MEEGYKLVLKGVEDKQKLPRNPGIAQKKKKSHMHRITDEHPHSVPNFSQKNNKNRVST